VENAPFDFTADNMTTQTSSSMEEQFQLSDIGNAEQEPLLSEQAQYKVGSSRSFLDDSRNRVHFSVGKERMYLLCVLQQLVIYLLRWFTTTVSNVSVKVY
jgi:hypothetical protein